MNRGLIAVIVALLLLLWMRARRGLEVFSVIRTDDGRIIEVVRQPQGQQMFDARGVPIEPNVVGIAPLIEMTPTGAPDRSRFPFGTCPLGWHLSTPHEGGPIQCVRNQ